MPRAKGAILLAPIADLGEVIDYQAGGYFHGLLRPWVPWVRARVRSTAGFDPKAVRPVDAVKLTQAKFLLIHGADDRTIPVDQSRKILAAGRPGQVRLIVLPGFDHQKVMWDLPGKTRSEAIRFLGEQARELFKKSPAAH